MADPRRSQRELSAAKNAVRREEMEDAIAKGRLVVRQMTPQERDENNARSAATKAQRATARKRR